MNRPYHTGLTGRVREAARKMGEFNNSAMINALDLKTYKEARRVRKVIKALRKAGEIKNVREGLYQYIPGMRYGRPSEIAKRIYRAMHVKGLFSATEVILLSEADNRYTYRVIRRLMECGDLEEAGTRRNVLNRKEVLFRVRHKDDFYLKYIARKD